MRLLLDISEVVSAWWSSLNCRSKFFKQYKWIMLRIAKRRALIPMMNSTRVVSF